jgi:hypothetical protein
MDIPPLAEPYRQDELAGQIARLLERTGSASVRLA